jgi:hypothetical protein
MNKTLTFAAITLVAVVMGLSALAPAVSAEKLPQVEICHNDDGEDGIRGTADDFWEQKFVNGNAVDKHVANHFDDLGTEDVADDVFDFQIGVGGSEADCDDLIATNP